MNNICPLNCYMAYINKLKLLFLLRQSFYFCIPNLYFKYVGKTTIDTENVENHFVTMTNEPIKNL